MRWLLPFAGLLLLPGCATRLAPPGPAIGAPAMTAEAFRMADGAVLPYRAWLPDAPPRAVVLALHGMNDSRDAWEYPGPAFARAGVAVYAPDQRGFGATDSRGLWPTAQGLASDAAAMAALLRARNPSVPLIAMGESMGGAVLAVAATGAEPPAVDAYVLLAPAVWGRARMNPLMRAALWIAARAVPGWTPRPPAGVVRRASDNDEALRRLSANPLTVKATRMDAAEGLVDLMDAALAAAPRIPARALILYGAKDEFVPPQATRAMWAALPEGPTLAFYPDGWHLLPRDLGRDAPIGDILAWIERPYAPLPSGADKAAAAWLADQASR